MRLLGVLKLLPLAFILAGVAWASDSARHDPVTEEVFLKQAGQLLSPSELPALRSALAPRLDALHRALEARFQQKLGVAAPKNYELYISRSSKVNAYFQLVRMPDGSPKITLTVTEGLIRKYFADPAGPASEAALKGLMGILSHEFAHCLDWLDPHGFMNQHGHGTSSQAIELRTDLEGLMLLRESGLEPDGLLVGLKMLGATPQRQSKWKSLNTFDSFSSTHPSQQIRQSGQRIAMTGAQYELGASQRKAFPSAATVAAEVAKLPPAAAADPVTTAPPKPRPIAEVVAEIRQLKKIPTTFEMVRRGVRDGTTGSDGTHRIFLDPAILRRDLDEIDRALIEKGPTLTAEEKKAVIDLHLDMIRFDEHYPAAEFSLSGENVKFYRSTEYVQSVLGAADERLIKASTEDQFFLLRRLKGLVGIKNFEPKLRASIGEMTTKWLNQTKKTPYRELEDLHQIYEENEKSFVEMFYQKVHPKLSPMAKLKLGAFYRPSSRGDEMTVSPLTFRRSTETQEKDKASHLDQFMKYYEARPEIEKKLIRAAADKIWEDRGRQALVDLAGSRPVEWEVIFKLRGMNAAEGNHAIAEAVKQLSASPDFPKLMNDVYKAGFENLEGNRAALSWTTPDLLPYLAGEKNPSIVADSMEAKIAQHFFARPLMLKSPKAFRASVEEGFTSEINARVAKGEALTGEQVLALREAQFNKLVGEHEGRNLNREADWDLSLIRSVRESKASPDQKRKWIREILVESQRGFSRQHEFLLDQDPRAFAKALIEAGAIHNEIEFISQVVFAKPPNEYFIKDRLGAMKRFQPEIAAHLKQLAKQPPDQALHAVDELLKSTLDLSQGIKVQSRDGQMFVNGVAVDPRPPLFDSAEWYALKGDFADALSSIRQPMEKKLAIFERLVATGPTDRTDRFFQSEILPSLKSSPEGLKKINAMLKAGQVEGEPLRIDVAKLVLEPSIASLRSAADQHAVTQEQFKGLLDRINELSPKSSARRDAWIESLVQRLRIFDAPTLGLAQAAKSTNWRKASPTSVNWLSMQENFLQGLTPSDRLALADYIADPRGRDVPPQIQTSLETYFDTDLETLALQAGESSAKGFKELHIEKGRRGIIQFAKEASAEEKVLAIETLFTGSHDPLFDHPDFASELLRNQLGYTPGSMKEKGVLAFLKSVPAEERPVTLAYLLSRKGEPDAGWKPIFEVFRTVGIKAGQLGGLWKLFGDASGEVKGLMDNAKPIDMAEVREIMQATLTPAEMALIKGPKAILGSASVKVAVLMELKDGREVVMMVRRPNVVNQIESNIDRAHSLLNEMEKVGLPMEYDGIRSMLNSVKSQLGEEILFTKEVAKIEQATEAFQALNQTLKGKMEGWKFKVPQMAKGFQPRDGLLFVEKANGETLNRMASGAAKKFASRLAGKGAVLGLFRLGWFDADRHLGNWIVDEKNRDIWAIDFGQAETFSRGETAGTRNEVMDLSDLLLNTRLKNVEGVMKSGIQLSENPHPTGPQTKALQKRVRAVVDRKLPIEDTLLQLVTAFEQSGIKLRRKVSFGALKGLVVIRQAGLLEPQELDGLLRHEVLRTQGAGMLNSIKQKVSCNLGNIFRMLSAAKK